LYSAVRGWVSYEALRRVEEQRKLLSRKTPPPPVICTGVFTRSYGLPCLHKVKDLLEERQPLLLEHFHPHWHLQRNGTPQLLLEPLTQLERRDQNSQIPKTSTRREPSGFEQIESIKRPSQCSKCHQIGHTMSSKICPKRYIGLQALPAPAPAPTPTPAPAPAPDPALAPAPTLTPTPEPAPAPTPASAPAPAPALAAAPTPALASGPTPTPASLLALVLQSRSPSPAIALAPSYNSPEAVFQRYCAARAAWYKTQPAGKVKTNQEYRRAMKLRQRYSKKKYDWCLEPTQMGRRYLGIEGVRDWTKEEKMAWIDWSNLEEARIEEVVKEDMARNGFGGTRPGDIWRLVERDSEEQAALYAKK